MNKMIQTELGARAYLDSLVMDPTEPWSHSTTVDGASLYRITDEHYVVIECSVHDGHMGHQMLTNSVLPREWECFASFYNDEAQFEAFHYGPHEPHLDRVPA